MNAVRIISRKRDGQELSTDEIEFVVNGFARDELPEYQMSALAMAIYFRGLSFRETIDFTRFMRDSGAVMQWPAGRPKVDKHSTGGIGDKISIPLAPALAVCGLDVPMVSGRGLGPTGGTLDKLESIPGYRCNLDAKDFGLMVEKVGCVIAGASAEIAPADKKLYALRDVTGTVPVIGLITASILSKKLSEGLDALVLDVKFGSGAFMKTIDQATELAKMLVRVANELGTRTTALLTDMSQPLGVCVGNALEIEESIEILSGGGPSDVRELICTLGGQLMFDAGQATSCEQGAEEIERVLHDGSARNKFEQMVFVQGGSLERIVASARASEYVASHDGFLTRVQCDTIGDAVIEMGGGRKQLGDRIDHSTGFRILKKVGDPVRVGEPIAMVHYDSDPKPIFDLLDSVFVIEEEEPTATTLIERTITIDDCT